MYTYTVYLITRKQKLIPESTQAHTKLKLQQLTLHMDCSTQTLHSHTNLKNISFSKPFCATREQEPPKNATEIEDLK